MLNARLKAEDFEVTEPLPNVTVPIQRSFAGNILTNRPNHANTSLFFWGFEKGNGSLTAVNQSNDEPWMIWLNGGPGASRCACTCAISRVGSFIY